MQRLSIVRNGLHGLESPAFRKVGGFGLQRHAMQLPAYRAMYTGSGRWRA